VTRLLLSPRHAGRAVSNGLDHGPGQWAAMFDEDTAERLRVLLTDPKRRSAPASTRVKYLLSGLLTCGKCGALMYASPAGTPNGRRWQIYRCMARQHLGRRLDHVDDTVDEVVIRRLSRPDAAILLSRDVDISELRAEGADLRRRRDALAAMLAENLLSAESVRDQASRLTEALVDVERRIDAASGDSPLAALIESTDVKRDWPAQSLLARRDVIRALFESITVLPVTRGARFEPEQIAFAWRDNAGI
jgi:hypothetical protein